MWSVRASRSISSAYPSKEVGSGPGEMRSRIGTAVCRRGGQRHGVDLRHKRESAATKDDRSRRKSPDSVACDLLCRNPCFWHVSGVLNREDCGTARVNARKPPSGSRLLRARSQVCSSWHPGSRRSQCDGVGCRHAGQRPLNNSSAGLQPGSLGLYTIA